MQLQKSAGIKEVSNARYTHAVTGFHAQHSQLHAVWEHIYHNHRQQHISQILNAYITPSWNGSTHLLVFQLAAPRSLLPSTRSSKRWKKMESTLSTIVRSLLFLLNINQILKCIADALPDFTKQNQHPIFKLSKAKNLGQKHYCSTIHRETWYAKWWSCASSEHVSSYKSWNISVQIYISHNMELGFILKQTSRSNLGIYFSVQVAAHKISEWMGNHKSEITSSSNISMQYISNAVFKINN